MIVNTLLHGDCLELMKNIPDKSVDMILTDPPYKVVGGGATSKISRKWDSSIFEKQDGKIFDHNDINIKDYIGGFYRVLKEGGHCYIMTNNLNLTDFLNEAQKAGFKFSNLLVWKKQNVLANRYYMRNLEYILFFYKKPAMSINNMGDSQFFEFKNPIGKEKLHPTEKPIELFEKFILNSSNERDLIFDPFAGSGTTAIAAINTNRNYTCMEKDTDYFNAAQKRINKHFYDKWEV